MAKPQRLSFKFGCFEKLFIAGAEAKGILEVCPSTEAIDMRIKVFIIGTIIFPSDENSNGSAVDFEFYKSEECPISAKDINPEYEEQYLEYSIPLLDDLPPSISLDEGSIQYKLHATMEEEFNDGKTQVVSTNANISVAALVNCTDDDKGDQRKRIVKTSVSSCLCILNEDAVNYLEISPRAYVPGDCVKINASVYNSNNFPWSYVQVALVQKIKLKYDERVVQVKRIISETKRGYLAPHTHQPLDVEYLRIPPLPPTTHHKYVSVSYKLKLISGVQSTASLTSSTLLALPVFIGNIPWEVTQFNKLNPCGECVEHKMLPIPAPFNEFANVQNCILFPNQTKHVPAYICYSTEQALATVDLS